MAERLGHSFIGSEHLLLAILTDENNVAAAILRAHHVTASRFRQALLRELGSAEGTQLTDAARTPALCRILAAAENTGSRVSSETLLESLLKEESCGAAAMLRSLGVSLNALRDACRAKTLPEPVRFDCKRCPHLAQYAVDLTSPEQLAQYDPLIGREREIEQVMRILLRRVKHNPVLIGRAGVGKSAIVEGIAQRIAAGDVPPALRERCILSLDMASLLAGARYRGDFEERFKACLEEAAADPKVILFLDEMHIVAGAGAAEGALDAANLLKPQLARGKLTLIGATTEEEYRRRIEKDAALSRRFQPVRVAEPTQAETITMLEGLLPCYTAFHGVRVSAEAVKAAVRDSVRYLHDRALPDKALDLLDEACAEKNLRKLHAHDAEAAEGIVCAADIEQVISAKTGIPLGRLTASDAERAAHLKEKLSAAIIGQEEAIGAVCHAVMRRSAGLHQSGRPVGSLLFLGATGVGKSALAQQLAEELYGGQCIRLDMSEYGEKHNAARLIGAPAGYVGYEDGGSLVDRVRRTPYCLIVFDELEKAHPDVLTLLLQILENGTLTDGQGQQADFSEAMIVLTSNLGASQLQSGGIGFANDDTGRERLLSQLRQTVRPELLGRLDEIVVFRRLDAKDHLRIAEGELHALAERSAAAGCAFSWTDEAAAYLAAQADTAHGGARAIRNAVVQQAENPLADLLLRGETACRLSVRGDALVAEAMSPAAERA